MIYQVTDWNQHYENSRSREIENCAFVCVPTKQHGTGFSLIMAQPDGAAIYGFWVCILGSCMRQKTPRHGWLTSDGMPTGDPLEAEDLAAKFHRPVKEAVRALEVLTRKKIGWILKHELKDGQLIPEQKEPAQTPDLEPMTAQVDEFVSTWNAKAGPVFGRCLSVSSGRRKTLLARLQEQFWRESFTEGIERMGSSDFCRGKNDRAWKANLDFFLRPDSLVKILEGKYDNHAGNGKPTENQL